MSRKTGRRPMSEINVVPYIDVMLVLLVIFMVTAPLLTQGVQVELPKIAAQPISELDDEPLIVSIKADGSLYLNLGAATENALTPEQVRGKVEVIMRTRPQTPVLVWGDVSVPYGEVVALMSELQAAGATGVGLVTESPTSIEK